MTIPSTNVGIAATYVPAKPLRRERIRCMKLSRGLRSYPGIETTSDAGLSTAVARAGVVVRPALAKRTRPMQITWTAPELQGSQCTAISARFVEFKESVVAKTNDKRQIV